MVSGYLLWIIFLFTLLVIGIFHLIRFPTPILQSYSASPPLHSMSLRKLFYTLQTKGLTPYSNVKVGWVTVDVALMDAKVAIMYYHAEDLLHPKKKRRLQRKKAFLVKHGWMVWEVREKDLRHHFQTTIRQISSIKT
ncbi:hypothetical protein ACFFGV_18130 [Pontibacillus salicampi]|uniref:DUF559 domain-containing protein n=1 Tax=Pontibacillus salicampi TaxID=1449801 RepID=A0ABV6LSW2_9BACI